MNPTQEQLDPQVVNLAKAIRETETRGQKDPYTARGASGEFGAYQYTKPTWEADTKAFLGRAVPLEKADRITQNEVAYKKIKALKDQGYNPAQIAAIWNSGKPEWEGKKGVNKYGAKYDVPQYVNSVTKSYQALKMGQTPEYQPTSSTVGEQPLVKGEQKKEGILKSLFRGITQPIVTLAARPIQLGAELAGATPEEVNEMSSKVPFYGDGGRLDVPESAKDVLKDVGRGAETVALGLPVGSIGAATKAGALAGAGAGLERDPSVSSVVKGAAVGAGAGFAGGVASEAISKLPMWLSPRHALGLSDDQMSQALATKSVGTKASLLKQSEKAVGEYGKQIDDILSKTAEKGQGNFALRATKTQFPDLPETKIIQKIKNLVPSGEDLGLHGKGWDRGSILSYIDKIQNGTATLFEKNRVKQVLNHATAGGYAKLARSINPSAGHDLAMTFSNNLATEIKQVVPETVPIFDEFAKEMALRSALNKLARKGSGSLVSYNDIIPYMAGEELLGGGGKGLVSAALFKAARSPATRFNLAKAAQSVGKAVKPVTSRAGLLPIVGGVPR